MHDQLGAGADRRDCPRCGREIMAAAAVCGYCWTRLAPLTPGSVGTRVGPPYVAVAAAPIEEASRRDCPRCGRRIMAAATTCGFCWAKLTPLAPDAFAVVAAPLPRKELPHAAL